MRKNHRVTGYKIDVSISQLNAINCISILHEIARIKGIWLLMMFLFLFSKIGLSQDVVKRHTFTPTDQCRNAVEFVVCSNGIVWPFSKDSIWNLNQKGMQIFPFTSTSNESYWLRIIVERESKITFSIKDNQNAIAVYNFTMYRSPSTDNFCDRVMKQSIIPIRSNIYNENTENGFTGIKDSLVIEKNPEQTIEQQKNKPFLPAVYAKAGDIYYLVVHNKSKSQSGFTLKMFADEEYSELVVVADVVKETKSKIKTQFDIDEAYSSKCSKIHDVSSINPKEVITTKPRDEKFASLKSGFSITGFVYDSISGKKVPAEISLVTTARKIPYSRTGIDGSYSMSVEGAMFYEVKCKAVGYREKTLKFMRQSFSEYVRQLDFYLIPLSVGEKFILDDIYFYSGTYAFTSESSESLEKLLEFMISHPTVNIEIGGHTNGKGSVKKNKNHAHLGAEWNFTGNEKKLSKMRAEQLKNFLEMNGVDEKRISTEGYGAQKMIYPKPKNKQERDINKRVEITIK